LGAREAVPVDLDPLVERLQPDVVHLHTVVNPCVLEWARSRRSLVTVQDHRYFCPTRGKWTRQGAVCRETMNTGVCATCFDDEAYFREIFALTERRRAALSALTVVVLSQYMRRELVQAGLPESGIRVIPPFVFGLDADANADGPPCIAFVGRLAEHKGVRDAIEAWQRSGLDLPLVMAGTGPLRPEAEAAGATVLGWLDPLALSRVYRRAGALLMPSRWQEPFGIAGLEALSLGVPVVAWDSGGIGEWHPGPLCPWGDVEALAAELRRVVQSGRRVPAPSGFDVDPLMSELEALYARVAGE
jgi:glycosyltransferase involved in cell wall biosynthesis